METQSMELVLQPAVQHLLKIIISETAIILFSLQDQGTDALGKGTFSGEDGGMVKMFNNTITGDRTVPVVDARTPIETGFDAYIAYSRDEKVP